MTILKTLGEFILLMVVSLGVILLSLNYYAQHNSRQSAFLAGKIPDSLPDGFYKGTVNIPKVPWLGKKFDRANNSGINLLQFDSTPQEAYPFKTYVGASAMNPALQVLKIDYNVPQNWSLVRLVLDEVVETKPNHFLGKLELRITPSLTLALGYFELDKK